MMPTDNADPDGQDLVQAMNQIRNSSEQHVFRMHQQAQRLVDWREYIRSRPAIAVGVALVGGYLLLHRSCPKCPPPSTSDEQRANPERNITLRASLASGTIALLGSLASQAIKHYAMTQLNNKMGLNNEPSVTSKGNDAGYRSESSPSEKQIYRNGMRR